MGGGEWTQRLEGQGNTLSIPRVRLLVVRGPDRGKARVVDRPEIVIGTAATADLCLTDRTVSRLHATVRLDEGGVLVSDLGSTNGTLLAQRRIRSAYAEPGEIIQVGATRVRLERERGRLRQSLAPEPRFGPLLGRSVAARRLFELLAQAAASDTTVLLVGESGVGKDLAAQALHEHSPRSAGPFVVFDCAAASPALIESDLFGHERGAFTGASERRAGAFQEASGGTIFLDEIGELSLDSQTRLLRVLDRREVRPIGGPRLLPVDVRVIAATNRDLRVEVNRGSFRDDLYYRLSGFPIGVPPLRERPEDVPLLADHFWRLATGDAEGHLPVELLPELMQHSWPGNVRELRHRVEREALLGREKIDRKPPRRYRDAKQLAVDAFEVGFLNELLARARGNVSEAARQADMDRVHLSKLLRRYGLRGG
jgi:transcriptional regulator with GAF, ATPase, and Fis domain